MLEGGIEMDDLVTIIGEQQIMIRLLQQTNKELTAKVDSLENENHLLKMVTPQ